MSDVIFSLDVRDSNNIFAAGFFGIRFDHCAREGGLGCQKLDPRRVAALCLSLLKTLNAGETPGFLWLSES